ncbi:MAG: (d)CMP kinase [Candidatus Omnitrophica bacterium]|nr:(d)CMP kinase [Candidatus Omnitrophota bacterium]MCM8793064.1 (d)CMP kinase [Candidatus Omnitrophota bacterium]
MSSFRKQNIVAIDGPAGAGKSTVARLVAKRLKYFYIDTGAMYRALTLKALQEGIDFKDEKALEKVSASTAIQLHKDRNGNLRVFLDGNDVTERIRDKDVNLHISLLSKVKAVRNNMVARQRNMGKKGRVVLEGRDIGTVVFPQARYKFYLDADFHERVKRRYREFILKGKRISLSAVKRDLLRRDRSDKLRKIAPLKKASDAVYIDTTNLGIEEVVEIILNYVKANTHQR